MPNELNAAFLSEPLSFLERLFVVVPEGMLPSAQVPQLVSFADTNEVGATREGEVVLTTSSDDDAIATYWAAYERGGAPRVRLGAAANFVFTPNLNGCTVACEDGQTPWISHIASVLPVEPTLDGLFRPRLVGPERQETNEERARQVFGVGADTRLSTLSNLIGIRRSAGDWQLVLQTRVTLVDFDADEPTIRSALYIDLL